MAAFDQGQLAKYNSLTDRHLVGYFSNDRMRLHLIKNGLITKTGEVVPDAVYRIKMARREHRRRVRDLIAQAIIHKALEMERSRQIDIRKKIEEIAKIELVRRVREDRGRLGDEECISYFSPGNMDITQRPVMEKKRTQSEIDEFQLPATADEKSRRRLRRLLPNEEIESKHLSQLDSLTLGEYSKIIQKQDRQRINRLPYLGMGKEINRPRRKQQRPKKVEKKPKGDSDHQKDEIIQSGRSNQPKVQSMTKLAILFHAPSSNRNYEVMVEQQPSGGNTLILYRDTLTTHSVFSVVSQRHKGFPFSLTFYINNVKDSRISTCCEYKHKVGKRIGGPNGHFSLFSVDGATPCYRCLTEKDMAIENKKNQHKDTKTSDEGVNEQGSSSVDDNSHSPYHTDNEFISASSSGSSDESDKEEINNEERKQLKKFSTSQLFIQDDSKEDDRNLQNKKDDHNKDRPSDIAVKDNEGTTEESEPHPAAENYNNNAVEGKTKKSNEKIAEVLSPISASISKITIVPKEKNKAVENANDQKLNCKDEVSNDKPIPNQRRSSTEKKTKGKHANYKERMGLHVKLNKDKNKEKNGTEENKNGNTVNERRKEEVMISPDKSSEVITEYRSNDTEENRLKNARNKDNILVIPAYKSVEDSKEFPSTENNDQDLNKTSEIHHAPILLEESEESSSSDDFSSEDEVGIFVDNAAVEKGHLIFRSPQRSPDSLHGDENVKNNDINSTIPSNENQIKSLEVKEDSDSSLSTNLSKDKLVNNQYRKISDSSDFNDNTSSSTATLDKEKKPSDHQISPPMTDDREDLKLTLPNDDYDSSKPSTSDRPEHLENLRTESTRPEVIFEQRNAKNGQHLPSESESEFESDSESDSGTDDETKKIITVENQMVEVVDLPTNEPIPSEGIAISVENDDVNFKRAKEICQSFDGAKISSLKIRNCELPNYVFNFISDRLENHPELQIIELSGCEVEISLLNLLAKSLKVWPNLERLILSDNQFTDYSLQNLIDMIKFLYDNLGNSDGIRQTLKVFDLSNCSIQENDLGQLIDMISKNTRLERFLLDGTIISQNMFKEICNALAKNEHLKQISLENCQITPENISELGDDLSHVRERLKI